MCDLFYNKSEINRDNKVNPGIYQLIIELIPQFWGKRIFLNNFVYSTTFVFIHIIVVIDKIDILHTC